MSEIKVLRLTEMNLIDLKMGFDLLELKLKLDNLSGLMFVLNFFILLFRFI